MQFATLSIAFVLLISLILAFLGQIVRSAPPANPIPVESSKSFSAAATPSLNLTSIFDIQLLNRIRDALYRKPSAPSSDQTTDYSNEEEDEELTETATSPSDTEESMISRRNCTRKKVPPIGGINSDEDTVAHPTNCKKKMNSTMTSAPVKVDQVTPPQIAMNCVKRNRTMTNGTTLANGTVIIIDEESLPSKCMNKNRTATTTTTAAPEVHITPCKKKPNQTAGVETSSKCWNKTLTHLISAFNAQENKIGDSCDPAAWVRYVKPIYDAVFRGDGSGQAMKSQDFAKGIVNDRSVLQKVCLTKPESDVLECRNSRKCECFQSYPPGQEGLFKCGNRPKQQQQKVTATTAKAKVKPTSPPKKGHITCITPKPRNSGVRIIQATGFWNYFYISSWIISIWWLNRI